uniref:RNA-directed DNA polymerase, eukaryota, reverse transcriptase zinc-binding domain protein n=1 Tax=Tanacetum cinerariifolium TaxID=118510 RepID=A0A6L2L9W6_TANCI|nr:RNA-directed DNA polymerase, eukaryota, reverse transcriptase zinc-binding domain protein [Tanacetum cinerariifolium]
MSVFVINFPDLYGAKDLWNTCKTYGHVVDAYIHNKRSKVGKRFGFMWFIKVFDVEHLVNNLCTMWVGRYKLHANVARFQRESLNKHSNQFNDNGTKRDNVRGRMNGDEAQGTANSYAHAVKGTQGQKEVIDDIPSLVLDDSCLNQKVYSLCLLRKVKEFASLTNLKIIQAHNDFTIDERVTWVEIEGVPCKWWSRNTFSRIASRWGTLLNDDELEDGEEYDSDDGSHKDEVKGGDLGNLKYLKGDNDVEEVHESKFKEEFNKHTLQENSVRQSNAQSEDPFGDNDVEEVHESKFKEEFNKHTLQENSVRQSNTQSEDPFGIYEVLKKKRDDNNKDVIPEVSLKYPPGFTPNEDVDASVEAPDILLEKTRENDDQEDGGSVEKQTHLRNEALNDAQESICLGYFKKSQVPRTAVGNSGGILCVWDPSMFKKMNETVSDYFTMVRGVWMPSGKRQSHYYRRFNEVRDNSERFGSVFNKQGAKAFNSFIYNAGLVEVPLGGCSFTWCHKSATKMSKLDRFLISDNLMCSCPSISSTSLDRLNKESSNNRKRNLKAELADLDLVIDKGEGADVDVKRRHEVVSLLQEVEKLERDFLNRITTDQNKDLEREVSKEGIKRAVWDCGIDKAPGPDGYTQILDGPFILNELVQWCKKKKKQAMIFKNQSNIDTITRVLEVFHRALGLRINMNKSKLMGIAVDISKVEQAVAKIGYLILKTPFTYLGSRVDGLIVIKALYGEDGKIDKKIKTSYPSIWLSIIHEVELLKSQGIDLPSFIISKLGNGVNTSFWDVAWRGDVTFKVLVPRLYTLETMKNIDVASKLSHGGLEFSFRRNPRGGVEHAQLEILKEKVEGCILSNMNDRWAWSLKGSGEFLASSVRKVIDATLLPKGTTKTRWIKAVPIKINIHAWKVKHDCLPTRVNISRRGMEIESMLCSMCDNPVESSRHLYFSCHFISKFMRKITRWWDIDYMEIIAFKEWLEQVSSIRLPLKQKQIFEGMCYILWW